MLLKCLVKCLTHKHWEVLGLIFTVIAMMHYCAHISASYQGVQDVSMSYY